MNWIGEWVDHVAVWCWRVELRQTFCHCLSAARHDVAVQQTCVEQMLQHHGHATNAVDVGHVILAARFGVGNVWNLCRNAVEVVKIDIDTGFVGNSQDM
ncbi:unannotated protein [freshwater metagenome]|uniref:Unannotated protein n=1 Tax=freshwater metagenome TaxID=449393 RepID=A0A6J6KQX6_9ZZZZ